MAAEKQSNGKQRDRKPNFSSAENNLISSRATDELETLRGRFSKELSNSQKLEFWKTLTTEVNALGVACRTEAEIRNRWRNMTRSAKEKFTTERIERRKTGGGPPPATLTAAEGRIIDVMQDTASYAGIPGGQETSIALNDDSNNSLEETWRQALIRVTDSNDERQQADHQVAEEAEAEDGATAETPACSITSAPSSALQKRKRCSMAEIPRPSKKVKKTAEDVYELQCAVLTKELEKNDLQIRLLKRILENVNRESDNTFALFSSLM